MKTKFKVGQVIKFKNIYGYWQYERIFAIGNCSRHRTLKHIRITHQGDVYHPIGKEGRDKFDCGCLGEIREGPYPLTKKECGR